MEEKRSRVVNKTAKAGISFGSALAIVISYTTWHSVACAILHGVLGWIYVIYFVLKYRSARSSHAANNLCTDTYLRSLHWRKCT